MKLAAIILLLLLSFNFVGYRLWFHVLQNKAETSLTARLDAQEYNEADLLTLKIPLKLPYQTIATNFERIDGEINVDGTIYKYVKRKVEEGHLVLLCLPHTAKMQLEKAKQTAFELTSPATAPHKNDGAKSIVLKNIFSDYDRLANPWTLPPVTVTLQYNRPIEEKVVKHFYPTAEQPPEAAAA